MAAERDRLVRIVGTYLIPRAKSPDSPLMVVFAGPTGAGKSTLLNSVAGVRYSEAGIVRPTTTRPLIVASESEQPGTVRLAGVECDLETGRAPILTHLTLVDTPDIDSTFTEHRRVAEIMMDAADVVIFVTSATRYHDAVPWEVLRRAVSRGAPVLCVLNRITVDSQPAVADYARLLRSEGMEDPLVPIHEQPFMPTGSLLSEPVVRPIRAYLEEFVRGRRTHAVERFENVLDSVLRDCRTLVDASEEITAISDLVGASVRESLTGPDLDVDLGSWHLDPVGLDQALFTGRTRRRLERWLERKGPASPAIREARARIKDELVLKAHRRLLERSSSARAVIGEIAGWEIESVEMYRSVVNVVDTWFASVDQIANRFPNRDLLSVVIAAGAVGASTAKELLERLGLGGQGMTDTARQDLITRFTEIRDGLANGMVTALAEVTNPSDTLERVRGALAACEAPSLIDA